MKMKKCKDCGTEISKTAKICPKCGKEQRNFFRRHPITTFMLFLVIIGSITVGIGVQSSPTNISTNANELVEQNNEYMTLEEFNKIQTGMTYEEVVNIVGSSGELTSDVSIGDERYHTKIYTWYGESYYFTGANANVTFQGGKVIAKAQVGL